MIHVDLLTRALDPAESAWKPFRPGVERLDLHTTPEGPAAALLRYAPGASVPPHRHPGLETVLILRGSQEDHRGRHLAGTLVINPPGSAHHVKSPEGCVVLVHWQLPVEFLAEDPVVPNVNASSR